MGKAVAIGSATSVRVDLTARDEHGASASTWVRIDLVVMTPAVGAPSFSATVPDQNAGTGTAFSLVLPAATGGDVTVFSTAINSPYVYAVSGLPAGLSFDAATRTVSGTPTANGTFTVTYTADDADEDYSLKASPDADDTADAASQTFTIQVTGNDLAPTTAPTGLTVSACDRFGRFPDGELDGARRDLHGTTTTTCATTPGARTRRTRRSGSRPAARRTRARRPRRRSRGCSRTPTTGCRCARGTPAARARGRPRPAPRRPDR